MKIKLFNIILLTIILTLLQANNSFAEEQDEAHLIEEESSEVAEDSEANAEETDDSEKREEVNQEEDSSENEDLSEEHSKEEDNLVDDEPESVNDGQDESETIEDNQEPVDQTREEINSKEYEDLEEAIESEEVDSESEIEDKNSISNQNNETDSESLDETDEDSHSINSQNVEFSFGDEDPEIENIKEKLIFIGFGKLEINEVFDEELLKAIEKFQEYYNLQVTGIIDEDTKEKIDSIYNHPLQEGNHHEDAIEVKQKLNRLGFDGIAISTNYGSFTAKRVSDFQRYYGLVVNGIADDVTLAKLDEVYNSPLQQGKSSSEMITIKHKLNWLGYSGIIVTSYFGSYTESRVKDFQRDQNLPVSGIIDENTREQLDNRFDSAFQRGADDQAVIKMKRYLNRLGFDNIAISGVFGSWTETRLKQFQEYVGLEATGKGDIETLTLLEKNATSPLQEGNHHEDAIEVKQKLNRLGFDGIAISTNYGSFTAKRVSDFQRYYGLVVNGIADDVTLTKLDEVYNSPLQQGKSSSEMITIKHKLNWLGYSGITVTSYFGSYTESRVKDFQRDQNLPVSGIIDEITREQLDKRFDSVFQRGADDQAVIKMKRYLNRLGFDNIAISGVFGSWTETRLKQFQEYVGLEATGKGDLETLTLLEKNATSPLQEGNHHEDAIEVKQKLNRLGFDGIAISTNYGSFTAKRVSDFQRYYGLVVNGIADDVTLAKLDEVYNSPFQEGKHHDDTIAIKEKLNRLGFNGIAISPNYGSYTAKKVSEFQNHFDLVVNGIADEPTLSKLEEIFNSPLQEGNSSSEVITIKEMLNAIGYGGILVTEYFGDFTTKRVKEFQSDYGLPVSGIVDYKTLDLLEKIYETNQTTKYSITFDRAVEIQINQGNPKYDGAGRISADEANVRYYLNPSNFAEGTPEFLQFLVLDKSTNLSASELNNSFLSNSGTLTNQGQAFIDAGRDYGLNELYLIAHALHETSHGTSTLAKGVGVDGNGNVVRDSNGNIIRDINHKDVDHIVYNMYGYGAHDDNPTNGGAKYAFDNGWFSPGEAVIGGAERIANSYIARGQNTLYKMKWDPEYLANNNSLGRQYATHIMWAEIQAKMLHNMLGSSINDFPLRYDIPEYLNQPGPDGSKPPPPTQNDSDYPSGIIGIVATSSTGLNLREGPGTNHDVIKSIPKDSEVEILDDNESGWLNIRHNGDEGWVSEDFIDIKNLYKVNGDGVNYRTSPAGEVAGYLSNELIGLSLDSNYYIVSEEAGLNGTNYTWYRITINGQNYWMASNFLEEVN